MATLSAFIISFLNTDFIVALVVSVVVGYAVKFMASAQGLQWKKWEGLAISAVKMAETAIPDDTANKGAKRLDMALKLFLQGYESATGVKPSMKTIGEVSSLLSLVHDQLELKGTLGTAPATSSAE